MTGVGARPAVDDGPVFEAFEPGGQVGGRQEPPTFVQIPGEGSVDRAGDVPGLGVDGFDLAAEPLREAGVDQNATFEMVPGDHTVEAWRLGIGGGLGSDRTRGDRSARLDPCLVSAVENGWKRAKRTVLASKAVNLLAALVLYFVAVGNVRGFAFTLPLIVTLILGLILAKILF